MGTPRHVILLALLGVIGSTAAFPFDMDPMAIKPRPEGLESTIMRATSRESNQTWFYRDSKNHRVITELDILMDEEQWDRLHSQTHRSKRTAGLRPNDLQKLWPKGVVSYELGFGDFPRHDVSEIDEAMADWEHYTCVRFKHDLDAPNRLVIKNGDGCYSYVGSIGGAQEVGLHPGCRGKTTIAHELGHALGLWHEQNRPDRDRYITVNLTNVDESVYINFERFPKSIIQDLQLPYDYYSIMHYSKLAFSNNGETVIETNNPEYQDIIGTMQELSFYDIKTINMMYGCNERSKCNLKHCDCPRYGFVGPDCACWCPGPPGLNNPVQYCHEQDRKERGPIGRPKIPCCKDHEDQCPRFVRYCTEKYVDFMRKNCKVTCGLCD